MAVLWFLIAVGCGAGWLWAAIMATQRRLDNAQLGFRLDEAREQIREQAAWIAASIEMGARLGVEE